MLTSMVVKAPAGANWPDFEIKLQPDPGASLVLLDVAGLEPVAANVQTRGYGVIDGEFFTGTAVGKRNIVAKIGLLAPGARESLYAFFLPKNAIKLRFNFDDRPWVEIDGYVEDTPGADRFSESAGVPTMQVSVICPKPNFIGEFKSINGVAGFNPPEVDLPYSGTTGGGFFFEMEIGGTDYQGGLRILVRPDGTTAYRRMEFLPFNIVSGWKIFISTHRGQKIAEFRPSPALEAMGAVPISLLGKMEDTYFWTQLFAGALKVQVITPGSDIARPWTIGYADQFAGV